MRYIKQFLAPYSKVGEVTKRKNVEVFCVICKTFVPIKGNRKLEACTNPICNGETEDLWVAEMGQI